jgi:molybdopterin-guanine dinucleotide biosynthesis protein A
MSFIARSGSLKVLDWLGRQDAATVDFPAESSVGPFFNINTPADLAAAEAAAILSELHKSGR